MDSWNISTQLTDKILTYLSECKWKEVAPLIGEIHKEASEAQQASEAKPELVKDIAG